MALDQLHSLNYPFLHIVKPAQPFGQLNSRILQSIEHLLRNAAFLNRIDHPVRIQEAMPHS